MAQCKKQICFTNWNDTKEIAFVPQTVIKKKNPTRYLRSVGEGGTVELDVEREKGVETANVTGPEWNSSARQ